MKPPVDAPTSSAAAPSTSIAERVERARELQPAARDVPRGLRDLDRRLRGAARPACVTTHAADAHLAGEDRGLRLLARGEVARLSERDVGSAVVVMAARPSRAQSAPAGRGPRRGRPPA